jgi:hypothetical protein
VSTPPPILAGKDFAAPSVFEPENLLREARRQKNLPGSAVPEICLLDPDGDIVRALAETGLSRPSVGWACYHTNLYEFDHAGGHFGIIGCAVGAPFAVLLAEQLFASGCRLLIFAEADEELVQAAMSAFAATGQPMSRGASWTTDAPFRETAAAIERCRERNILAVEMEAAGLYAFAQARQKPVLCFAHVTNQMAVIEGDFEKGEADGSSASLIVMATAARAWRRLASRRGISVQRAQNL